MAENKSKWLKYGGLLLLAGIVIAYMSDGPPSSNELSTPTRAPKEQTQLTSAPSSKNLTEADPSSERAADSHPTESASPPSLTEAEKVAPLAIIRPIGAAPVGIVCADFDTVRLVYEQYVAAFEGNMQLMVAPHAMKLMHGVTTPDNGPNPEDYGCSSLPAGTTVHVVESQLLPVIAVQLPSGEIVRGVTMPAMIQKSPPTPSERMIAPQQQTAEMQADYMPNGIREAISRLSDVISVCNDSNGPSSPAACALRDSLIRELKEEGWCLNAVDNDAPLAKWGRCPGPASR